MAFRPKPAALAAWTEANRRAGNADPVDWCAGYDTHGEPCWEPATPGRPICKACAKRRTEAMTRMRTRRASA